MTSLEELLDQEAELARVEKELAEKKLLLAKQISDLKASQPITIEISLVTNIIQLKSNKYQENFVALMKSIPMRQYEGISQINSIPAKYFEEVIPQIESLTNVTLKWKTSKEDILTYIKQPVYTIGLLENNFTILIKDGYNPYTFHSELPQARVVKKNNYKLGVQEAIRLSDFLDTLQPSDYVISYMASREITQAKINRDKFKTVKSLTVVEENKNILNKPLLDFQTVGVEFQHLANRCILGDEMGLGKSPQAIGAAVKDKDRTLFVVPSHLVLNWVLQIEKFTNTTPHILVGTRPSDFDYLDLLSDNRKKQFTVIGIGSLSRPLDDKTGKFSEWANLINISNFDRIVVDEAHYIKTEDSNRSWTIRQLKSRKLTLLTGTPVMNRPKELWPLLNMINPEVFNNQSSFEYAYSNGNNGVRNVRELRNILEPIMLRRLKSEVQSELDPINRIIEYVELDPRAKKVYNKCLTGIYEHLLTGNSQVITHVLALFTRLQQVCTIAKYDYVTDLAERIIESKEGEKYDKVLIGTQYVKSAYQIAKRLNALIITGEMNMEDRMKIADKFQNGSNKILVCSTKSVQEGLDLTAAGTIINVDLLWTPAGHSQFEGRAYGRLNDSHAIDSYYLLANKTIEEMKWGLLQEKLNTIDQVVDGVETSEDNTSIFMEMVREMKATGFSPLA